MPEGPIEIRRCYEMERNVVGGRGEGRNGKENLKESIHIADYVTEISGFKTVNGHVIQVQTLNGFLELNYCRLYLT